MKGKIDDFYNGELLEAGKYPLKIAVISERVICKGKGA
jgi:hypothetical protein